MLLTFDFNSLHKLILVPICKTRETGHMTREKICITRHATQRAGFVQFILMVAGKC